MRSRLRQELGLGPCGGPWAIATSGLIEAARPTLELLGSEVPPDGLERSIPMADRRPAQGGRPLGRLARAPLVSGHEPVLGAPYPAVRTVGRSGPSSEGGSFV